MKNPHPECRISLNFKISFLTKSNFSRLSDGSKERFSKRVFIVDELNETKNKESSMNAWELKSFASIQKKVHEQTSLAKNRLSSLQRDIKILEKSLSTHEIRRKRSIEKSNINRLNFIEDRENKIESDLPAIKRTTL